MDRLLGIGAAAKALGVSIATLRRWEESGRIEAEHTAGGHRRYDLTRIRADLVRGDKLASRRTLAYTCVSSADHKADLERQEHILQSYCSQQGWVFETITDFGSGMNCHKKGLRRLIEAIISGEVGRIVITHKERLPRFGAELLFVVCEASNVEVVILNQGEDLRFEDELAQDMLEMIALCSARLYGSRSRKIQKLLERVRQVVEEALC